MVGGNSTPVSRYALVIRSTAPWVRIGPMPGSKPDRKSTRLNSSHVENSYAVFCLKKKKGTARSAREPAGLDPRRQRCVYRGRRQKQRLVTYDDKLDHYACPHEQHIDPVGLLVGKL